VAINLAFACSMRAGEIVGLQWDHINVSEQSILDGDSWVYIDREIIRVSASALKALDQKDVLLSFLIFYPETRPDWC